MAAIQWGPWERSGGNGMRVGMTAVAGQVTSDTDVVQFDVDIYTQNQYQYVNDEQTLVCSGDISGNTTYINSRGDAPNDGGGVKRRAGRVASYLYGSTEYGSSPGTMTMTATVTGAYNGVTPSVTLHPRIPARPYEIPAAPSDVSGVLASNDASANLTWTRHATASAPYSTQSIYRRDLGTDDWSEWKLIATVGGGAVSYTATGLTKNHVYEFRIRANNSAGSSPYSSVTSASRLYTSPSAPFGPIGVGGNFPIGVQRLSDSEVKVTWCLDAYRTTSIRFEVQRSPVGEDDWTQVADNLPWDYDNKCQSWIDSTATVGNLQYRVRAYSAVNPPGTHLSDWGMSGTVSGPVPPLAPTMLDPNGDTVDFTTDVLFSWQHNPGTDQSPQTRFELQSSTDGGDTWVTRADEETPYEEWSFPPGTFSNGVQYIWRVRTMGDTAPGWGPWSNPAAVSGTTRPTVTITSPGPVTELLPLTVEWTYNQDEGVPQAAWDVRIVTDTQVLVASRTGTGTTSSVVMDAPLRDGRTYIVQVRARSGLGVWSELAAVSTTIDLLPPAQVDLTTEFDQCSGTMILTLTPEISDGVTTVPATSARVERKVPGGEWVTIAENLPLPTTYIDVLPATNGVNLYRVTAVSDLPSYWTSTEIPANGTDGLSTTEGEDGLWAFLSWGPAFTYVLRVHGDLNVSDTSSRMREVRQFLGRRKPVLLQASNTDYVVSVRGSLHFDDRCPHAGGGVDCTHDSAPEEWRQASLDAGIVCYRDFTGRRVFGMLSPVTIQDEHFKGYASVSFTVTEADYEEETGTVLTTEIGGMWDEQSPELRWLDVPRYLPINAGGAS